VDNFVGIVVRYNGSGRTTGANAGTDTLSNAQGLSATRDGPVDDFVEDLVNELFKTGGTPCAQAVEQAVITL
jgi:hypothetical protein